MADDDKGLRIIIICGALVGVAVFIVLLRLWVRIAMIRQLGWDDYFMAAATIVIFAEMIIIIPEVAYGAGRHVTDIRPPSNVVVGLHFNFVTQPLCLIALFFTKISVGFFLLRLTPSQRYRYFIWGVMVFTFLSFVANFLTVFFQCRPLAFIWDNSTPGGQCIPPGTLKFAAFFNSSIAILTNLTFALLPVPMIWTVHLNKRVKIAVAGVLSLGIFATAAGLVKITYLSSYGSYGDFLYDSSEITIWTTVEICTAIIASSLPCLKPLFRAFLGGSTVMDYASGKHPDRKSYIRNNGSTVPSRPHRVALKEDAEFEMYGRWNENTADVTSHGFPNRSNMDADSEDAIWPMQGTSRSEPTGITKTTQVFVSVDNRP